MIRFRLFGPTAARLSWLPQFLILLAGILFVPLSATAQTAPVQRYVQSQQSVPDENTLARLVWATMVALDNANRTNNYSVLNNLGTPNFQRSNSAQRLSEIFTELRRNRVDIGRTILSSPNYYIPPEILSDGSLRLRGGFDFRPKSVRFDLIYKRVNGGWQLNAISVVEVDAAMPK